MTTKYNLNRIQALQNKCIEIISKNKNTEASFRKLKIYKIKELIKIQEIKISYRLINKLLPNKISQQLQSDSNIKVWQKHILTEQEGRKSLICPKQQEQAILIAISTNLSNNYVTSSNSSKYAQYIIIHY